MNTGEQRCNGAREGSGRRTFSIVERGVNLSLGSPKTPQIHGGPSACPKDPKTLLSGANPELLVKLRRIQQAVQGFALLLRTDLIVTLCLRKCLVLISMPVLSPRGDSWNWTLFNPLLMEVSWKKSKISPFPKEKSENGQSPIRSRWKFPGDLP